MEVLNMYGPKVRRVKDGEFVKGQELVKNKSGKGSRWVTFASFNELSNGFAYSIVGSRCVVKARERLGTH